VEFTTLPRLIVRISRALEHSEKCAPCYRSYSEQVRLRAEVFPANQRLLFPQSSVDCI
ncbi:unnamed protein product, partial [Hymenolepis diminuta]